jgi:hypothetical protein
MLQVGKKSQTFYSFWHFIPRIWNAFKYCKVSKRNHWRTLHSIWLSFSILSGCIFIFSPREMRIGAVDLLEMASVSFSLRSWTVKQIFVEGNRITLWRKQLQCSHLLMLPFICNLFCSILRNICLYSTQRWMITN